MVHSLTTNNTLKTKTYILAQEYNNEINNWKQVYLKPSKSYGS